MFVRVFVVCVCEGVCGSARERMNVESSGSNLFGVL